MKKSKKIRRVHVPSATISTTGTLTIKLLKSLDYMNPFIFTIFKNTMIKRIAYYHKKRANELRYGFVIFLVSACLEISWSTLDYHSVSIF